MHSSISLSFYNFIFYNAHFWFIMLLWISFIWTYIFSTTYSASPAMLRNSLTLLVFQYVSTTEPMLQERALPKLSPEIDEDTFLGQSQVQSSPETPFPYVKGPTEGGPAPIIYSVAQSKVAVYRPNELTTTTEPPVTASPTSSSTAKPFHYQAPLTNPPLYPPNSELNYPSKPQIPPHFGNHAPVIRKRPLIYAKRRPEGPSQVSRPFEYLSRLSHFLSDRVFTGRTKLRKKSGDQPTLVTRRLEGGVS